MAPMELIGRCRQLLQNSYFNHNLSLHQSQMVRFVSSSKLPLFNSLKWKPLRVGGVVLGVATLIVGSRRYLQSHVTASSEIPVTITPTKSMSLPGYNAGLKLTLYQFPSCPFCSKVRAYLDYRGMSYDIVEVNYFKRREMKKWALSSALPLLVVQQDKKTDTFLQINESTLITSFLESYSIDPSGDVNEFLDYYPCIEKPGRFGKIKRDYLNKYFLMFGDKNVDKERHARLLEEREWRQWVDDTLVRLLPPNIYRSWGESFDTVRHFDNIRLSRGSSLDHTLSVYGGAPAMLVLGKMLKRKYNLHDDVRLSLYQACNYWMKSVGKHRQFMGGDEPNLADLAVYGVLNAIEGCQAFTDIQSQTRITPWYERMKSKVTSHAGSLTVDSDSSFPAKS